MVDKRPLEGGTAGDDDSKKQKIAEGSQPAKAALSMAALEKAKHALQLQKALKEKLKSLPQVGYNRQMHAVGSRVRNSFIKSLLSYKMRLVDSLPGLQQLQVGLILGCIDKRASSSY
jgi:hypothetical protein